MKTKEVICNKCNGHRFISRYNGETDENGYGWGHLWNETCDECNGEGTIKVPMTHFDEIKNMNKEELAEFIHHTYFDGYDDGIFEEHYIIREISFKQDINKIRKWLEEPVEG